MVFEKPLKYISSLHFQGISTVKLSSISLNFGLSSAAHWLQLENLLRLFARQSIPNCLSIWVRRTALIRVFYYTFYGDAKPPKNATPIKLGPLSYSNSSKFNSFKCQPPSDDCLSTDPFPAPISSSCPFPTPLFWCP